MPYNTVLAWLQEGERASGATTPTGNGGVLNEPLVQLLENTDWLKGETDEFRATLENLATTSGQSVVGGLTLAMIAKAVNNFVHTSSYYVEGGGSAADAYIVQNVGLWEPITALYDGMEIRVNFTNPNTGASTIGVAGITPVRNIVDHNLNALTGGEIIAGEARLRYRLASNNWVLNKQDNALLAPLTKEVLAPQLHTTGFGVFSVYTFPHTLGTEPSFAIAKARCLIADGAWAIGDSIVLNFNTESDVSTAQNEGQVLSMNATNCFIYTGNNGILLPRKDNGQGFFPTANSWQFEVTVYA